ncbi:hypothetical protein [Flavobacterium sp. '19STA2R22 D10 B1']|uniref:hypothetical protein n=1 Tax=Flavobacterium aerium TaxID=3037261 RepID=UPI00278BF8A0|nr:hypothetical protein [Flavobacterium sp. '19STA2R22 D10 B1']
MNTENKENIGFTKELLYKIAFAFFIIAYFPPSEADSAYKAIPTTVLLILLTFDFLITLITMFKKIFSDTKALKESTSK